MYVAIYFQIRPKKTVRLVIDCLLHHAFCQIVVNGSGETTQLFPFLPPSLNGVKGCIGKVQQAHNVESTLTQPWFNVAKTLNKGWFHADSTMRVCVRAGRQTGSHKSYPPFVKWAEDL